MKSLSTVEGMVDTATCYFSAVVGMFLRVRGKHFSKAYIRIYILMVIEPTVTDPNSSPAVPV